MSTENTQENDDGVFLTPSIDEFVNTVDEFYANALKFKIKGTASAVPRARKALSKLSALSTVIRKELQADKLAKAAERRAAKAARTELPPQ